LTKYIRSVLWREAVRLSYIWAVRCLKVKYADIVLIMLESGRLRYDNVKYSRTRLQLTTTVYATARL